MKKSKRLSSFFLAMFSIFFVFTVGNGGAAPIELQMSWTWPTGGYESDKIFNVWADEIEAATNQRVKIIRFSGATVAGAAEHYDAVVNRIVDIGQCIPSYLPGRFPLTMILELPGNPFNNGTVASVVEDELFRKHNPAEWHEVKPMFWFSTGPIHLATKFPVRTLEDIKGKQIRASATSVPALKALGAMPVVIPISGQGELYEALQKGMITGALIPGDPIRSFRIGEVTKYFTKIPFVLDLRVFLFDMNLKTWNSLPKDIQQAFEDVNKRWSEKAGKLYDINHEEGLRYGVTQNKLEVSTLSPQEVSRWRKILDPLPAIYLKDIEAKKLPAEKYYNDMLDLCKKYNEKFK